MERTKRLLGFYDYTVILTYLGMICGIIGINLAIGDKMQEAIVCLMLAGICDMFDGAVASTKKNREEKQKKFGIQIDSLSDLICFCVLPSVIISKMNNQTVLSVIVATIYVLCGLIRLAYFNVCEEERQQQEATSRKWYEGLPVTSIAIIFPLFYLINKIKVIFYIPMLAIISVLFIVPFKIKKPKKTGKIVLAVFGLLEFVLVVMGMMGVI